MNPLSTVAGRVVLVAVVQLVLVGAAVAPQLSARLAGDDYLLRVAPVDPIDPFRGAYVDLDYPDLALDRETPGDRGTLFVTLVERDGVWVASGSTRDRPDSGTYLACDDSQWQVRCGIESLFLPQDEAAALQEDVAGGEMVAVVKVDGRGNAAIVALEPA